ncbi:hypothetical protein FVA74_04015 [Salinibacterium sp. dk2585]|uniref:hypothetical protein n=1 Tax=unclassified Salinibacterium TaxID=2632331 RepID=UPI0011C24C66|nr:MULTISPECIES: hypothetical protein [unclassified Salinibacterium]QEE60834.1 hypothetical protein FVA74_04015 [Salinibacterium sp. dk2585]TXK55906.1 hypothetical protein FVP63_04160 [Salinibacterium sp. dk5596]
MVVATGMIAVPAVVAPEAAEAADARLFDPGHIISDDNFFNGAAMTEAQIQSFLNTMAPGACGPNNCLKQYAQATSNKPQHYSDTAGAVQCTAYAGAASESAARIIFKVQRACGISAKVILVTLQKERGLVTKTSPIPADFTVAMGMGCPDTAACDVNYYGFFNQVWSAAKQFKTYRAAPNYFKHRAGATVDLLFHPNAACGSTRTLIRNAATAALYNYTPYQPNAAALANLGGTGDACSSYGNRNFFRDYTDWFGSPISPAAPAGSLDSVAAAGAESIRVRGWTFTGGKTQPISIHVYVDGKFTTSANADSPRSDVAAAYPFQGQNHGFDHTFAVPAGSRNVCVYGLDSLSGGNALLACRTVLVPPKEPAASDSAAVYRFWSDAYNGHFYTRSVAERNKLITQQASTWTYEGPMFGAFGTQVPGTVPAFRFWSATYNGHFYTTSAAERDRVIANYPDHIWKYETIAFYVYPASTTTAGTRPVARFWSPVYQRHFYTASANEAQKLRTHSADVWTYEMDPFRVPVAVPNAAPVP